MLPIWFVYIAAAMRLGGGLAYFVATLKGKAKPHPVSWLLWGIVPLIAFIAELQAGVGTVAIVTLALGISPLLVFSAVMYKNPRALSLTGFNLLCVIITLFGIALWITTNEPNLAIAAMILADLSSSLPTLHKSWKRPDSEFSPTYLISATSMVITLLTIADWQFAAVAYPVYVLIINLIVFSLTTRKVKSKKRRRKRRVKARKN